MSDPVVTAAPIATLSAFFARRNLSAARIKQAAIPAVKDRLFMQRNKTCGRKKTGQIGR
jgi:hypothetical protein